MIHHSNMNPNESSQHKVCYLKTDNNIIVRESAIRWVKKMDECLEICTKPNGCDISLRTTHRVCKHNSIESYEFLNKYFSMFS